MNNIIFFFLGIYVFYGFYTYIEFLGNYDNIDLTIKDYIVLFFVHLIAFPYIQYLKIINKKQKDNVNDIS